MESTMNVGIGLAICGLMGWMMSSSKRYRSNPTLGLGRGLLFGLGMLVPFVALIPIRAAAEIPFWVANLWLGATVTYQVSVGVLYFKHRTSAASAKVPAKESLKVNYGSMELSEISPAA